MSTPIILVLKQASPFELMCDANELALGAVLGQQKDNPFQPIYYSIKYLNYAQGNYIVAEQGLLIVVYDIKQFHTYLLGTKVVVPMDHIDFCYLMAQKEAKLRFVGWMLLLQEFDYKVKDQKRCENQVADHLTLLELDEVQKN